MGNKKEKRVKNKVPWKRKSRKTVGEKPGGLNHHRDRTHHLSAANAATRISGLGCVENGKYKYFIPHALRYQGLEATKNLSKSGRLMVCLKNDLC